MKNSKDYSPKLAKLLKTLKKDGAPIAPPVYADPVEAIVYAFISAFATEANASKIVKRINIHFVDINDLRVSRPEEILDVVGETSSPQAAASAQSLLAVLNAIFEKYDKVSLDVLTEEGKRQARKDLEEIPGMTSFAAAYTVLTAIGGHAIPLTEGMADYLRQHDLVHPDSTLQEIESFLERQIAAADAYTFYTLFRAESEGGVHAAPKASAKAKKAPAKKTGGQKATAKKKIPKK